MARLAQTPGLTDIQQEILRTVKDFVDKEIIPNATALEHAELQYQLGAIVISRGDTARGRAVFQDALDRFRAERQQRGEARSLSALGHVAADAGAWSEAIDGSDDALEALAARPAIDDLLYAGDRSRRTRVVLRGAHVQRVAITTLDPHAQPATMTGAGRGPRPALRRGP